ncbi:MAG: hypothetical protein K9K76_09740 [Halanaerobiales bacterium]|nr:hypothetical protein [Halanaerobiales bacterium]
METKIVKKNNEKIREIDYDAYKKRIKGFNKIRWQLIFEGGLRKSEVDMMTFDEMLEAFAALSVLSKQKRGE